MGSKTIILNAGETGTYLDTDTLLAGILEKYPDISSVSIIAISSSISFLKNMIRKHIGTILTGNITSKNREHIPDFSSCTVDKIRLTLESGHHGYAAEVIAFHGGC